MIQLKYPPTEKDNLQGSLDALVTLVEYGDYECPHCGRAHVVVKKIQEQVGRNLCFVFRNFPLTNIHPHALQAACAAEAAGLQDKFWEMHDMLFENQDSLEQEHLLEYARALDLDLPRFERDMTSEEVEEKINNDILGGVKSGVTGTPTFFINGVRHEGSYEYEVLLLKIEEAGNKAALV
jgi:protein-disulfide isomerase